ncbi:MAG: hypothetical protein U0350_28915 [Caldilineaceae bacterium]
MKPIQWNTLGEFMLPCTPSADQQAAEQVTAIVQTMNLSAAPLARLQAAVVTAACCARDGDPREQAGYPVCIRIYGAGLDANGRQQGWGFFLIEKRAEPPTSKTRQAYHSIEIYLYR